MKRLGVGIALAAMITMGCLAGCGGNGAPTAKVDAVEVTYYYLPL